MHRIGGVYRVYHGTAVYFWRVSGLCADVLTESVDWSRIYMWLFVTG